MEAFVAKRDLLDAMEQEGGGAKTMDHSHLDVRSHGDKWSERQEEYQRDIDAERAKGPDCDKRRVLQLLHGPIGGQAGGLRGGWDHQGPAQDSLPQEARRQLRL